MRGRLRGIGGRVLETDCMQGIAVVDRQVLDAAALCGHLVPAGSVYGLLAEHRARLFGPEMFADLFPSGRGRPSVPGEVIAAAMVLKELEGLSDRQAATALATDIRLEGGVRVGVGTQRRSTRRCLCIGGAG